MASPTKTAQNEWISPFGEDFLQLVSPQGQGVLGGITSAGLPYGALAVAGSPAAPANSVQTNNGSGNFAGSSNFTYTPAAGAVLTSSSDTAPALTIVAHSATQSAPMLTIQNSNANVTVMFTSTFNANVLGFLDIDNGTDGLVIGGSTDGDVTEAVLTLASDSTAGVNLFNGPQTSGFNLLGSLMTITGSVSMSGKVTSYNGQATANGGIPIIVFGPAKLTAQSAAKSAQLVFATGTTPGAGMYVIYYVATVTTADTTSLTLGGATGFQVIFTNANGDSVVKTSNPTTPNVSSVNATGTTISGCVVGYAAANTNINYNFGYTAGTGNFRYDLAIFVTFLGA